MLDLLPDLCDLHGDSLQVADPLFRHFGANAIFYGEAVTLSCFEDNSLVRALANPHRRASTWPQGYATNSPRPSTLAAS